MDFVGPDKLVIGTSYAKTLTVWNFKTNKPLYTIKTPDGWSSKPKSFTISPGGNYLGARGGRTASDLRNERR